MSLYENVKPKNRRNAVYEKDIETTHTDANGETKFDNIHQTVIKSGNDEPDYIKLYTKMWCEFNSIPTKYHQLFLSLAMRMSYANSINTAEKGGQMVFTGKPIREAIMAECGWKSRDAYQKGLQALVKAGAIRQIARGCYQINPLYAGRGQWCYNPNRKNGGVKDLIAEFDFAKGTNKTRIVYVDADDPAENKEMHAFYGALVNDDALYQSAEHTNPNVGNITLKVTEGTLNNDANSDTEEREAM